MIEVYVLDKNLEHVGIIDAYNSLIWANRYSTEGDCELYLPASDEMIKLLQKDYYLIRNDDDMVCRIQKIELDTDIENGNYLIVTGYDVKNVLNQRVIWGTATVDGNVEDYLREVINKSLGDPNLSARQLRKENGQRLFYLGNKANFTEVTQEQQSYTNIGEMVRDKCDKYKWGYRVLLSSGALYFQLYKGTDRTNDVIFSDDFENLISSKYIVDDTNIGNVALVAGEGEGSERTRNVSGYAEGMDRYEIYVDARDLSKTITWGDLKEMYPPRPTGVGNFKKITTSEGYYWVYNMDYIDIQVVDDNQLEELIKTFPSGTFYGDFYRIYNVDIADLPTYDETKTPSIEDGDSVILRDVIYSVYLLNRGYEKMTEYGVQRSFEGEVEPDVTFIYKKDYFLGDIVTVENEFGIRAKARIVEVVEVSDENGYSISPNFEYVGDASIEPISEGAYILTEDREILATENNEGLLLEEYHTETPMNLMSISNIEPVTSKKISELDYVSTLYEGCCFPLVQEEETKRVTFSLLRQIIADSMYPVGSIYMSVNPTEPSVIFGGTWEKIENQFLLASGTIESGESGGNVNGKVTLSVANLPAHNHTASSASAGAHTHSVSGTAASAGAHTHSVSSTIKYAITGTISGTGANRDGSTGTHSYTVSGTAASAGAHTHSVSGTAASAGAHTHTITVNNTGNGSAVDIMPPYLAVNMWKRIA